MRIAILEDNAERADRMKTCLSDRFAAHEVRVCGSAAEMIEALSEGAWDELSLISLDHDLELEPRDDGELRDPGTGREVADFLAQRQPVCPVIIHSTNATAVEGMKMVLAEAGWQVVRVAPEPGLEWIDRYWFRAARDAIVDAVGSPASRS